MALSADQFNQFMGAIMKTVQEHIAAAQGTSSNAATLASSLDARIGKFHYDSEAGQTFEEWMKRYGNFIEIDGKDLEDSAKVRLLMGKLGDSEYQKFANSVLPELPDKLKYKDAVTKLKTLFCDSRSLFVRQYECFRLKQLPGQDIQTYTAQVNAACENAKLELSKEMLKCFIAISGLNEECHDLREKALRLMEDAQKAGTPLTLEKLSEEFRAIQLLRKSAQSLANVKKEFSTNSIAQKPQQWKDKNKKKFKVQSPQNSAKGQVQNSSQPKIDGKKPQNPCFSCGKIGHWRKDCKYREATCHKCGLVGHIAPACRNNSGSKSGSKAAQTNSISINQNSFCLANETENAGWFIVPISINNIAMEMKLDTASQIDAVFTTNSWKKLNSPKLETAKIQAKNCNGVQFSLLGKFSCSVSFAGKPEIKLNGYVSKDIMHDLLGIPWIEKLEILPNELLKLLRGSENSYISSIQNIIPDPIINPNAIHDESSLANALQNSFPNVFSPGLGHCTKIKAKLHLKPDARPVFCKARPVPFGAKEAIEAELDRLISIGAIKKVEFSNWAAPILAVKKKNGKTRVCIDFSTGLNNALELNRHPLPRPEDIFTKLNGAKFFSQLDLRDAYLQFELDEDSKKLCGINTHRGLFQAQRMPFGVKSAPAIFQNFMDNLIAGIPGVFCYLDDLIIANSSIEDHIATLNKIFAKIQEAGLKIQLEKCKFLQKELKFLGHIVNAAGIRPDPARSEAIRMMPAPTNITSLRSFLGALNYYGRFVKEMRELRAPLDELLRKDVKWDWSDRQQKAFEQAKKTLLSDLLLTHYDPSMPIVVAADASNDGIGATISHIFPDKSEKAIEHASITFSDSQKNYSQIEKEALGLIFAVQKFHRMLYGRKFTLLTDHKPLVAIFGSKSGIPIYAASRLQRWALILSNYNFDIQYIKTTSFGKADVLSRLIADYPRPEEDKLIANICTETECYINSIFSSSIEPLPITSKEISKATMDDKILQKLSKFTKVGWPTKCRDSDLIPYFPKREQISEVDGCLTFGQRTIIPEKYRQNILKTLHFAHPGIVRMKAIAREHVYWPGINFEIEKIVRQCSECQSAAKNPIKNSLHPWPISSEVFERIHIDFAGPCQDGHTYLLVIDSYSKWPEVFRMSSTSASATVKVLRALVHRLGIPKQIVSDNGSQLTSAEFDSFCKEFAIQHTFSPPYHPQSNGQIERFVDTFKRAMQKCRHDGPDWAEKMLMAYRTTPQNALGGHSPDELFLGRKLRTKLTLVHPNSTKNDSPIRNSQEEYREKMSAQFDSKHGAKPIEFMPGENVYLLNFRYGKTNWLPGKIVEKIQNSPLYRIEVPQLGRLVRRHANQLRRRYSMDAEHGQIENFRVESPRGPSPRVQRSPYPVRQRKPTHFLQVDPSKKRYNERVQN